MRELIKNWVQACLEEKVLDAEKRDLRMFERINDTGRTPGEIYNVLNHPPGGSLTRMVCPDDRKLKS